MDRDPQGVPLGRDVTRSFSNTGREAAPAAIRGAATVNNPKSFPVRGPASQQSRAGVSFYHGVDPEAAAPLHL